MLTILFLSCTNIEAIEFDEYGAIDTHGYISQGYLRSDKNNYFCETEEGDYNFYEIGVSMTSEVSDKLRIGIQFLSYALGDFGNTNFHVNWANADYYINDWIGFKAGKIKIYHGLFNRNRDADFLRTSILLPQSIYNEAWRSTISSLNGFEAYGTINAGLAGRFKYNVQTGKVDIEPDGGVAIAAKEKLLEKTNTTFNIEYIIDTVNEEPSFVYSLMWETPLQGLKFNTTYWSLDFDMVGTALLQSLDVALENSIFRTSASSITGSVEYTLGNFIFISEYSYSKYDFEFITSLVRTPSDLETEGYYVNGMYRFTNWFETGLYYSVYYPDKNNKSGKKDLDNNGVRDFNPIHSAWQKDTCLSFRFDLSNNWIFKLEGHVLEGTAVMMKAHNTVDYNPADIDLNKNWLLFGAKFTYSF